MTASQAADPLKHLINHFLIVTEKGRANLKRSPFSLLAVLLTFALLVVARFHLLVEAGLLLLVWTFLPTAYTVKCCQRLEKRNSYERLWLTAVRM